MYTSLSNNQRLVDGESIGFEIIRYKEDDQYVFGSFIKIDLGEEVLVLSTDVVCDNHFDALKQTAEGMQHLWSAVMADVRVVDAESNNLIKVYDLNDVFPNGVFADGEMLEAIDAPRVLH